MGSVSMRVGIDLVSVDSVRESVRTHAERYLERVYTARELDDCRTPAGAVDAERLAARFAAKEAALKVLRPGDVGLSLRSIEVRRAPEGWVELELSGPAATLAAEAGLSSFALSVTHEGGYASAVVVAELDLSNRRPRPMMNQ
jgi:holo-[acyl-carrier protein] synthase